MCTLAGPALAIAECLLDESADHFISGQILELQLEILRVHIIKQRNKNITKPSNGTKKEKDSICLNTKCVIQFE